MKKAIALQSMYICKSRRTGGEVGAHQDSTYLYTNPLSCYGFWLGLHEATLSNGCLWATPGSHTVPLQERLVRSANPNGNKLMDVVKLRDNYQPLTKDGGVPVETGVGDLVVLHGQLVHWSAPNKSENSRHAFVVHCVDGACEYPADNWLQYDEGKPFPAFTKS
eukprot:c15461_g1_i1.p1 GENE.c15461_g1_i1~~c15461_g1_i1.p1  ORF type:complete len:164 (+),score=34.11 c15461_g1_i1:475-966(+)